MFLDRDGVINENRPDSVKSWEEFAFLPGVFTPLQQLAQDGRPVIVVSNQGVIGRGLTSREAVEQVHSRMRADINSRGGRIDAIYYCPHHPDDGCECRKPRPGLLLQAADEMRLDLASSYLIGDAVTDVEAAIAAGCWPILVLTGRGRGQAGPLRERGYGWVPIVSDLSEALDLVSSPPHLYQRTAASRGRRTSSCDRNKRSVRCVHDEFQLSPFAPQPRVSARSLNCS